MPKHSILIAAFNRLEYLSKTVESCLASSETDFEILIADDGSVKAKADNFYSQMERLDERIKIYRWEKNEGVGTRFNQLHQLANGKFVHVIGSDDLMHPNRIKIAEEDLVSIGSKKTIWCSQAKFLDANYKYLGKSEGKQTNNFLKGSLLLQPYILHPTVSYYNHNISNHKQYRVGMRAAIDYMYYVDNFFDMQIVKRDAQLTYLVHSSTGITRDKNTRRKQLDMHDFAMHKLWSYFEKCTIEQIHALRTLLVTNEYSKAEEALKETAYKEELIELIENMQISVKNKLYNKIVPNRQNANKSVDDEMVAILEKMKVGIKTR